MAGYLFITQRPPGRFFLGQRLAWIIQKGLLACKLRLQRRDPRLKKAKPLLNDDLDRITDKTGSSPGRVAKFLAFTPR